MLWLRCNSLGPAASFGSGSNSSSNDRGNLVGVLGAAGRLEQLATLFVVSKQTGD